MILEKLSADLDVSVTYLISLARTASHQYKTYTIPKRSGGLRTIHHPSRRLKAVQRWIAENIIKRLPLHEAATAYRLGQSILRNAEPHAPSRYLLRMDFTRFFETITESDIREYIKQRPALFSGWDSQDVDIFCMFLCRRSALTIGAPSSPGLSNALCYDMDCLLAAASARVGITYTRYADDLFFSTQTPGVLLDFASQVHSIVRDLPVPGNLQLNTAKTRHSSKRGPRRITGIVLGSDGQVHIGRHVKRKIRSLIFSIDSLDAKSRASLAGLIAYASDLDPQFINSLIRKYGLPVVRSAMRPPRP